MFKAIQNLHTHTSYCDGKNTPEEMILKAIERGFSSIGFSGHSYMHFSPNISMSVKGTEDYKREIRFLQEKYANQIDIFCGLEFELYSETDLSDYDYLIGSCHYFKINGEYIGFDRNAQTVKSVIDEYFGGDAMKYAKAYFELLSTLPQYGSFDIVGHFDIAAKHAASAGLFDESVPEYLCAAYEAVDALAGKIPFFEINTGGIARGYRTYPYPAPPIIKRLLEKGFLPVITSDCHDANMLDCAFEDAAELLRHCGGKERYILTKEGFTAAPL